MKSIFGISLADEGLYLSHLLENNDQKELLFTGRFDYPFEYRDDLVFDELKFLKLSDIIQKQKEERQIEDLSIYIVLPHKFAYLKRIALPRKRDLNMERIQIEWDMGSYITGDLSQYKVIKTDHVFLYDQYEESVVLAIKKSLIKVLMQLADSCNAELGAVVLNNFALEKFLQFQKMSGENSNQLIFRIGKNSIESHFYAGGNYHSSVIDNINLISEEVDPTQKIIGAVKENYKYFTNLGEQLPYLKENPLKMMIYGTNLSAEMYAKVKSNFTAEIPKLEIINYPQYLSNSHSFIEAFGAAL